MDWLGKLQDTVLGGLPTAAVALCPDHLKRQWLERLADHNPFRSISANHDLLRATRLAWLEAAQDVLHATMRYSTAAEWHGSRADISAFDAVIGVILLDARDLALDRRVDPGSSPIDAHVEAVIGGVPELVTPGDHVGIGSAVSAGFTATLSALSGWREQEIPSAYQQIAEQGLSTVGGGPSRRFGELVFAAFAEIIKDPKKYPQAREAFYIAMDKLGRDIGQQTLNAVKGLDGRLDTLVAELDARDVLLEGANRYLEHLPRIAEDVSVTRAGVEELLRRTDQSASAPFQLRSGRLSDALRPFDEVSDAWHRLIKDQLTSEVPLVGREKEMARLLAFATGEGDPRPLTWQVLWGAHATGKSRLAREWLRVLGCSTPAWEGGFAADRGADLLSLLSLEPSAPTAIVIDDAMSYGDSLWQFLQRAERWCKANNPVRVLIVAHEDLAPPAGGGFERVTAIRALRQVAPLDRARTAVLFRAGRASPTTQTVPGIMLEPLVEGAEQAALLDAVTNATRRPLSAEERQSILKDADGRPAFLTLAATDPDGWRHRLKNYAQMIAKDAEALFPASVDGLKVLAASVLIGPFPDELRRSIAPGATPADRLARLFPGAPADPASEIPRFQPDILGFHVLGTALGALSSSERRDFARSLQAANRDRFVAQIDACFAALEPSFAYYCRLLAPTERREEAKFAAVLDDLVSVMAESPAHLSSGPSSAASAKRRDAILSLLEIAEDLSDANLAHVVREALKYSPIDLMGDIFDSAIAENGIGRADVPRWLALIDEMISNLGPTVLTRVPIASFKRRDPRTDGGLTAVTAALGSAAAFDRMEAAYELGVWLLENPDDGRLILNARLDLLKALVLLLEKGGDHDRTAAAWCLKQAARWVVPLGPNKEVDRAVETASVLLRGWIAQPEHSHAVVQLIGLFGFEVDCRIAEHDWKWFTDTVDLPHPPQHRIDSDAIALLRRIAREDYDTSLVGPRSAADNAEAAAGVLLRSGAYEHGATATVERFLLRHAATDRTLSTLCRVAATRTAEAHALLASVVGKMKDRDDVALFVCAFALLSGEFGVIDVMRPIVEGSRQPINLDALLAVARERSRGGAWSGGVVVLLCERLANFRVRRNGNRVFRLRATDTTGRPAYYFVLVQPEKERDFRSALGGTGMINLEDHGTVIASCYGESPSEEVLAFLKEKYDYTLS